MNITGGYMISPDPVIDPQLSIPFRARLAKFDRPAKNLRELMEMQDEDFLHASAWSVLGRRISREEYLVLLAKLHGNAVDGKRLVLIELEQKGREAGFRPVLPGLQNLVLLHQRKQVPVIGGTLAAVTMIFFKFPALTWPIGVARSIPGKFRWTYRHSRKALMRLGGKLHAPTTQDMRRVFRVPRSPVPEGTDPLIARYYQQLQDAVDGAER